jgi:hypothetical protein
VTTRTLGFDRRIELAWVELAATLATSGRPVAETRPEMMARLEGAITGRGLGSSRGKTVTILSRIWLQPPAPLRSLRDYAVAHLREVAPEERVAIHWAMTLGAFPFFRDVAAAVGRLLALQSTLSLAQVHARLRDTWGERSTVTRAVPPVVATMAQWGLLARGARAGVYRAIGPAPAIRERALDVLLEALILSEASPALHLEALLSHPAAFPFDLSCGAVALRSSRRLRIEREGIGAELVACADLSV